MKIAEQIAVADKTEVLEDESYTVLSLCEDLAIADEDLMWSDGSCCACPSYTTVPCSC